MGSTSPTSAAAPTSPTLAMSSSEPKSEEGKDMLPDLPVTPRRRHRAHLTIGDDPPTSPHPPSFAQSEFETIIRRQRNNRPHNIKAPPNLRTRYPNLDHDWEFAGWGQTSYLELVQSDITCAQKELDSRGDTPKMGQFIASALAGNDIIGSVFYAFPAVAAACGIYSPIALLFSSVILLLFRPVLLELVAAVRLNGGTYAYLLQFSGKSLAAVGAAATMLDAVSTSTVSAATAGSYLVGELTVGNSRLVEILLGVAFLVIIAFIALAGLRESGSVALTMLTVHILVMLALMLAALIHWARTDSSLLAYNYTFHPPTLSQTLRTIFNGICIGFLGVTGFECTPTYIESLRPGVFPHVLRNLIVAVTLLNAPLMLLVLACMPMEQITGGTNVLSLLAERVAGRWLRIVVVVDAVAVLLGGVLAGIVMLCGLVDRLAHDHTLPALFLRRLPLTQSEYPSILFSLLLSLILYASCGFQLDLLSSMFAIAFLFLLALYPISHVLLRFNRDRLPRTYRASLGYSVLAVGCMVVLWVGNIIQDPKTIGLFAGYFGLVWLTLWTSKSQVLIARLALWVYDQAGLYRLTGLRGMDRGVGRLMGRLRARAVGVWVKTDDMFSLIQSILYVQQNEATTRIVFVHAYQAAGDIPSEMEANCKLVDEAFPSLTIDLVFVQGTFSPILVQAVSSKLDIPPSRMFISCLSPGHKFQLADYAGLRVISL
ncbi:hypothetical protein DACRYDRAFT_114337 [Dacryopinax primogenitus]|uniref:AAAP amino acid permease n=1 Tax=Dacryopinax primogenitus (strain DJM 731) TaxID=1858805 RepID=M5G8H0_DACPD|nr:uncharacterized protein DACRYDRAFT_114337 [Dacryopinax primogenitus]EJU05049.1 hypothetical protein DACRYDRAFT_114337 [Dacryopinax primogenitus]